MTRNIAEESKKLWTNSFQLLARAEGKKYDDSEVRRSNVSLQQVLDEAMDYVLPHSLDKGKGKMGEEEEVLMRGFSPHS